MKLSLALFPTVLSASSSLSATVASFFSPAIVKLPSTVYEVFVGSFIVIVGDSFVASDAIIHPCPGSLAGLAGLFWPLTWCTRTLNLFSPEGIVNGIFVFLFESLMRKVNSFSETLSPSFTINSVVFALLGSVIFHCPFSCLTPYSYTCLVS